MRQIKLQIEKLVGYAPNGGEIRKVGSTKIGGKKTFAWRRIRKSKQTSRPKRSKPSSSAAARN